MPIRMVGWPNNGASILTISWFQKLQILKKLQKWLIKLQLNLKSIAQNLKLLFNLYLKVNILS